MKILDKFSRTSKRSDQEEKAEIVTPEDLTKRLQTLAGEAKTFAKFSKEKVESLETGIRQSEHDINKRFTQAVGDRHYANSQENEQAMEQSNRLDELSRIEKVERSAQNAANTYETPEALVPKLKGDTYELRNNDYATSQAESASNKLEQDLEEAIDEEEEQIKR